MELWLHSRSPVPIAASLLSVHQSQLFHHFPRVKRGISLQCAKIKQIIPRRWVGKSYQQIDFKYFPQLHFPGFVVTSVYEEVWEVSRVSLLFTPNPSIIVIIFCLFFLYFPFAAHWIHTGVLEAFCRKQWRSEKPVRDSHSFPLSLCNPALQITLSHVFFSLFGTRKLHDFSPFCSPWCTVFTSSTSGVGDV